jgi:hypothetical protein
MMPASSSPHRCWKKISDQRRAPAVSSPEASTAVGAGRRRRRARATSSRGRRRSDARRNRRKRDRGGGARGWGPGQRREERGAGRRRKRRGLGSGVRGRGGGAWERELGSGTRRGQRGGGERCGEVDEEDGAGAKKRRSQAFWKGKVFHAPDWSARLGRWRIRRAGRRWRDPVVETSRSCDPGTVASPLWRR